ncbi:MAG TPA: hypothetical protein DCE20_00560 [Gammaproteobacteria bacterium]|nr:hypothetical protein [Gammaproteobacteria bacterium]
MVQYSTGVLTAEHINDECCKPPLSQRELEGIFLSILKREMRNG